MKRAWGRAAGAFLLLWASAGCTTSQGDEPEPSGPYRRVASVSTGEAPASLALADFDQDANLDLVVANNQGATLSTLRGNGKGGFAAGGKLEAGQEPRSVAAADFDGDGFVDVAVVNQADSTLGVYSNQKDGTFSPAATLATGQSPTFVTARDLNQDGRQDLLVTNADDDSISVFLAAQQGGFEPRVDFEAGTNPVRAALVDLDSDGALDVVTATRVVPPTVSVLMGDGKGAFGAPTKYKASNRPGLVFPIAPQAITAGDVNGDGKQDVVVGNRGLDILDGEVWLLAGEGTGTLSPPAELPGVTVLAPAFMELVDFDGDGILDIVEADHDPSLAAVVAAIAGSGFSVCIASGDGQGSFEHTACLPTGDYPYEVATGLLNADGQLDLVTADAGSDSVSVHLANF
ncbi:MAG: VCBS repeat-containing protein [Myxococcales bacterium]|nr:VCBS repeat-containing protein [Myxococcales bacterium]